MQSNIWPTTNRKEYTRACDCKRRSQQTLPIGRSWPNRNQSYDHKIVRSGVTGALGSLGWSGIYLRMQVTEQSCYWCNTRQVMWSMTHHLYRDTMAICMLLNITRGCMYGILWHIMITWWECWSTQCMIQSFSISKRSHIDNPYHGCYRLCDVCDTVLDWINPKQ